LLNRAGKFQGTDAADADNRFVYGTTASPGTVRATARLIYSLDEGDRLKEGEILICRTSSPPWTPLIARSAGVVAETRDVLMHCAIVTRAYAIPCVVGVGPIDERIRDGDTITVDGTQGIIRVE
jgi:phosphoenolpyruvate synthase/pyruvate phosphate dikinase